MNHSNNQKEQSKFLSLILRHQPETIQITLDHEGWTNIDLLLKQMVKFKHPMDKYELISIVENSDKKRFQISKDQTKIRAVQGHSTTQVNRDFEVLTPPNQLFHGTATRFLERILQEGLIAGERHHVHLSSDINTAIKVGQRHGKPVILLIDSQKMHENDFEFYQSENGVWLTNRVPVEYLKLIPNE